MISKKTKNENLHVESIFVFWRINISNLQGGAMVLKLLSYVCYSPTYGKPTY